MTKTISHRRRAPRKKSITSTATRRVLPVAATFSLAALVGTGIASAHTESDAGAGEIGTSAAAAEQGASAASGIGVPAAGTGAPAPIEPLATGCENSDLPPHTGFQVAPACVATGFGEVAAAEDNPQLLIVEAPEEVTVGQEFTIKVSTRNLVRDRFLAAADGGYYLESSTLNEDGIVRGHFHTSCRVLGDTGQAPEPERQAIFVPTEDGGGGKEPDTVTVKIPGLATAGQAQCATWSGDGSHRIPMMQFANQIPAFDAVRITVKKADGAGAPADAGRPAEAGAGADETPGSVDTRRPDAGSREDAGQRGEARDGGDARQGQDARDGGDARQGQGARDGGDARQGADRDRDADAAEGANERTDSGR
jgi:hypothetical protein